MANVTDRSSPVPPYDRTFSTTRENRLPNIGPSPDSSVNDHDRRPFGTCTVKSDDSAGIIVSPIFLGACQMTRYAAYGRPRVPSSRSFGQDLYLLASPTIISFPRNDLLLRSSVSIVLRTE